MSIGKTELIHLFFTIKTTKAVSLQVQAAKTVDGEEPGERCFEFELCTADGSVMQTKPNDAAGDIIFDALNFGPDDIGTHVYTIDKAASLQTCEKHM